MFHSIGRHQDTRPRVINRIPHSSIVHAGIGETVNISCTFDVGGSQEALLDVSKLHYYRWTMSI